ncbi:hypothetical protein [Kingella oralis]|uniref:hypothetical protein n=1 Tax=Kingella oralis TaxID=505 RepID=UPI0034E54871
MGWLGVFQAAFGAGSLCWGLNASDAIIRCTMGQRQPESGAEHFRLPLRLDYFLPEQAFRRLPRARASPCTPP